jgi:hypothetical protein
MGLRRLLTLMGLGAGLMYLYDPDQGNRRRAMLAEQFTRLRNDSQDFFADAKRDLQNRRQGMQAEPITGGLGGLSGDWTPGVRLVAALAGGGMAFYGLAKSGIGGIGATLVGLNLVSRSIFNRSMADMAEEMPMQTEGTKDTSSGKRASNGHGGRNRQRSSSGSGSTGQSSQATGINASLTSEQGAGRAAEASRQPEVRTPIGGDVERALNDENVGFDSILPGNPPQDAGQ